MQQGELREALDLLMRARTVVEGEPFSDLDRSEIFYRLGVCRYKLSSISTAIGLFNEAYGLAEQSQLPCDLLRSNILAYRSRCYRRQRDLEAAREDVERALELAQSLDDSPTMANVYVQASLVAERMGHWVLARSYAERAKSYYEELNDQRNLAGLLNNLGGLNLMLGKPEEAIEYLKSSYSTALDADSMEEAAQATGSLAAVHLELNDFEQAERFARCRSSRAASTSCTRSAPRNSSSAVRSWSRAAWTMRRKPSVPPIQALSNCPLSVTAPAPGSRSATSPRAGATTGRLPVCTGTPPRRFRT